MRPASGRAEEERLRRRAARGVPLAVAHNVVVGGFAIEAVPVRLPAEHELQGVASPSGGEQRRDLWKGAPLGAAFLCGGHSQSKTSTRASSKQAAAAAYLRTLAERAEAAVGA